MPKGTALGPLRIVNYFVLGPVRDAASKTEVENESREHSTSAYSLHRQEHMHACMHIYKHAFTYLHGASFIALLGLVCQYQGLLVMGRKFLSVNLVIFWDSTISSSQIIFFI